MFKTHEKRNKEWNQNKKFKVKIYTSVCFFLALHAKPTHFSTSRLKIEYDFLLLLKIWFFCVPEFYYCNFFYGNFIKLCEPTKQLKNYWTEWKSWHAMKLCFYVLYIIMKLCFAFFTFVADFLPFFDNCIINFFALNSKTYNNETECTLIYFLYLVFVLIVYFHIILY